MERAGGRTRPLVRQGAAREARPGSRFRPRVGDRPPRRPPRPPGPGTLYCPERAFGLLHPGGTGTAWGGWAGQLRADHVDLPKWGGDVWGIELTLPEETARAPVPTFRALPSHPSAERDLAFLLAEEIPVEAALSLIQGKGGRNLREVEVFDLYRGDELPEGTRLGGCAGAFSGRRIAH